MTAGDEPATGRQYEIRAGDDVAVVTGVGATLRACVLGGREVIRSFPADGPSPAGHGQVLAPWPNRLQAGRYEWAGRTHQLPLSEPARGNAIHGLVRWEEWPATELAPDRVRLEHRIHPQPGYPFTVDLAVTYALDRTGLTVTAEASNPGSQAAPLAVGFHPYLLAGGGAVDGWSLTVPAATRLLADDDGIPTSSQPVEGTASDYRAGRLIGGAVLDTAFADLERGVDGRAEATLASGDDRIGAGAGVRTTLWVDASFTHLMVFTGDTLGEDLRRRAVAVEPMTAPPNALASGQDLIVLAPGDQWEGRWGIRSEAQDGPHR